MTLTSWIYALGSAPLFAARPFLAAFLTALVARFGANLPFVGDSDAVRALSAAPEWFTSSTCLAVLGLLAGAEVASARSPEVRAVMSEFDALVKSAVAFLVSLAILDPSDADLLRAIDQNSVLGSIGAGFVASVVYACNWVRRGLVEWTLDVDEQDDVGLQTVLAWIENTWTVFGILLLLLLPLFALALSAIATVGLYFWRKRAERLEKASFVPCAACATPIRPTASACLRCGHAVAAPRAVGVFGQPRAQVASDLAAHRFALVARKRCPTCATRLEKRAVRQACAICGRTTFASRAEFESYLAALQARLPRTLLVCALVGAVPLVGVIPGVLYYRLTLVSGLRGYVPPLRGCTTRFLARWLNYGLIALQPIPVLGAAILPLMCWSNYALYRGALRDKVEDEGELALDPPRRLPA